MNYRWGIAKKIHISPCSFWHTKQFCHIFTPVDQLLCSILIKNGPTTYNEHFSAYNVMALQYCRVPKNGLPKNGQAGISSKNKNDPRL